MKEIPLNPLPAQRFQIILGGVDCDVKLYSRLGSLYLNLAVNGIDVCMGAICLDGASIVQFKSPYFKGSLHFLDLEGATPPVWRGLGSRYVLLYAEEGETLATRFKL